MMLEFSATLGSGGKSRFSIRIVSVFSKLRLLIPDIFSFPSTLLQHTCKTAGANKKMVESEHPIRPARCLWLKLPKVPQANTALSTSPVRYTSITMRRDLQLTVDVTGGSR